jgi:hypothetical protein
VWMWENGCGPLEVRSPQMWRSHLNDIIWVFICLNRGIDEGFDCEPSVSHQGHRGHRSLHLFSPRCCTHLPLNPSCPPGSSFGVLHSPLVDWWEEEGRKKRSPRWYCFPFGNCAAISLDWMWGLDFDLEFNHCRMADSTVSVHASFLWS